MIGSALSYVALRLLGEGPDDGNGAVSRAREWILEHGGAMSIPSWGKTYLSVKKFTNSHPNFKHACACAFMYEAHCASYMYTYCQCQICLHTISYVSHTMCLIQP